MGKLDRIQIDISGLVKSLLCITAICLSCQHAQQLTILYFTAHKVNAAINVIPNYYIHLHFPSEKNPAVLEILCNANVFDECWHFWNFYLLKNIVNSQFEHESVYRIKGMELKLISCCSCFMHFKLPQPPQQSSLCANCEHQNHRIEMWGFVVRGNVRANISNDTVRYECRGFLECSWVRIML